MKTFHPIPLLNENCKSYDEWVNHHIEHLEIMFSFLNQYKDKNTKYVKFEEFCIFVYNNSSKELTPYL